MFTLRSTAQVDIIHEFNVARKELKIQSTYKYITVITVLTSAPVFTIKLDQPIFSWLPMVLVWGEHLCE